MRFCSERHGSTNLIRRRESRFTFGIYFGPNVLCELHPVPKTPS